MYISVFLRPDYYNTFENWQFKVNIFQKLSPLKSTCILLCFLGPVWYNRFIRQWYQEIGWIPTAQKTQMFVSQQ